MAGWMQGKYHGKYKSTPKGAVDTASLPDFASILRNMYKRGHPDLLRASHPDLSRINDDSLQLLNAVITVIKKPSQFPPRTTQDLTFHLRHPEQGHYEKHILEIRTAGGDCKKQLTKAFESFFVSASLLEQGGRFKWNKEFFPLLDEKTAKQLQKDEAEAAAAERNQRGYE